MELADRDRDPDVDFDTTDLSEVQRDAALRMLFQRARVAEKREKIDRLKSQPPLQNPSKLAVYESDEERRMLFIADLGKRILAQGSAHVLAYLRSAFKFDAKQAKAILDEARREMAASVQAETELLRKVAIARFESLIRRAHNAADLTNEIRATKEWARVVGAYQSEEQAAGDLAALMRQLAGEQGPNPEEIVDAEFELVDDEAAQDEHWEAPDFEEFDDTEVED